MPFLTGRRISIIRKIPGYFIELYLDGWLWTLTAFISDDGDRLIQG